MARTGARRGISFYLGLVMVVAGAGMLGWVGWQMWGTNYVAHQTQQRIVEQVRHDWGSSSSTGRGRVRTEVPEGEASALVRIPAFGRTFVQPVLEGVSEEVLASGIGHFRHTAEAGQVGNYALAAHRITHGEPFRDMPDLRPGDRVIVETRDATYVYVLDTDPNALVVDFTQVWVLDPVPVNPSGGVQPAHHRGEHLITLTTCSELFHTDNRMIAFGHLVRTIHRPRPA